MNNLLVVNNIVFVSPEGGYSVDYSDKTIEYESESGKYTVDVVRENMMEISASYKGLEESTLKQYKSVLKPTNTVKVYDAAAGIVKEIRAIASDVGIKKIWFKHDISVWELSFKLKEM